MKQLLHGWSLILTWGLLGVASSCSKNDAVSSPTVNVPQSTLTFEAFATEAQTVTVDANCAWRFEVTGDTQICDVTREEGGNVLTVTPKINYDNAAYTARIVITAGEGSNTATQTVSVTQKANTETYLNILNSDLSGDNPIVTVNNDPEGGDTKYEIRLATNNKLSMVYSDNQATSDTSLSATSTRSAIEGCDWITYEVSEESTAEGTITVLMLSCAFNKDTKNSRTAFLEIVSGEGTNNKVIRKRIGITQLADTPTIIVNAPEGGLVATYDQDEPLTFSVASNIEFTAAWSPVPGWAEFKEIKNEQGNSHVRTFSVEVQKWMGTSPREATLQFVAAEGGSNVASAIAKITQTAAPKASISLKSTNVVFNNGEESGTKYVDVECSISSITISTRDSQSSDKASWLEASYDESLKSLVLKVNGTSEATRSAVVTLSCGANENMATATLTVTQLGTQPSLTLDPESVLLDSKGTAVVVTVYTNQTSWEIVDATAQEGFTLTPDKEKNTITVTGTALDNGTREHTYTVKAGEVEKKLTVSQRMVYKVGDALMSNGKPVGIVYQVDEAGQHGKAFSLTVHNINNKKTQATGKFVSGLPASRTDGKANRSTFMAEPDWENNCQVTKWVADLATTDGVDWYVPAIEELIELAEYMTGIQFSEKTYEHNGVSTTVVGIPFKTTINTDKGPETFTEQGNIDTANKNWDLVRSLYKSYTNDQQYVVFIATRWEGDDEVLVDSRFKPSNESDYFNPAYAGDLASNHWLSSTGDKINNGKTDIVKTVYFTEYSVIESYRTSLGSDFWDEFGGSIHPICQF